MKIWKKRSNRKDSERIFSIVLRFSTFMCRLFGNVRELKNVIQRAVLMAKAEELTPDLLPQRIRATAETHAARQHFPIHAGMTLDAVEREFILMTLGSTKGNKKEAAQSLGISRRALYDKLKK